MGKIANARYAFCLLLAGCGAPEPPAVPAPPPRDMAGERKLAAASAERDAAEAKLAAVDERDRERCEFQVGDCKILVNEAREDLMTTEDLTACRVMTDEASVTRCLGDELGKRRKQAALASLVSSDVTCMKTVLACTDELVSRARSAAAGQRAGQRERELRATERGARAMAAMAVVDDKVGYLRATLPASQAKACPATDDADRCTRAANSYEDRFEAELDKDDYRQDAALDMLEQMTKARAACSEPELACLSTTLEANGLYPEGKKWVARNFETLERREVASGPLSPGVRSRCLNDASRTHQTDIVQAYVAYSRESVLFFRVQLDKAFLAMHEAQVACLQSQRPRHAPARATLSVD